MYGAIIGDIVGSKYEFNNIKTKDFPLFSTGCDYTDDTIMTVAVAKAIMTGYEKYHGINGKEKEFETLFIQAMQDFGRRYPYPKGAYGARFSAWIRQQDPEPYNSYGNGSAMRVSPCALFALTLEEAEKLARLSAAVSHNHPEGIKGAEATAAAVFLAKTGKTKDEIRQYVSDNYYELDFTLDAIRKTYAFEVSCQRSVPQAIVAFLESESFEDAIRNVISIGGDCDTTGAITGSIAWAYYAGKTGGCTTPGSNGIDPAMCAIREQAKKYLPEEFIEIADEFRALCRGRAAAFNRMNDIFAINHSGTVYLSLTGTSGTERLQIHIASDREMEELIAAQTDPELAAAYNEMLDGSRSHPEQRDWYAVWMLETKDGAHVGDLSFKGLQPDGSAEIGYGIDEAYRNNGYATEAVGFAVRWALDQPGVARVEAETAPDNRASRRVLEKCGFVPTGTCGEEGPRFVKTN